MYLKKGQLPILAVNLAYLLIFVFLFLNRKNYEFILYIGVTFFFLALIISTNKRNNFSNGILWGLTLWGVLHMSGGFFKVGDGVLYGYWLIPGWLRYDQFVHAIGFGIATLIGYSLLKPYLTPNANWKVLTPLLILVGMGFGALNEIIEFIAVLAMPETGVGGYENTLWDLVFNTIGAAVAVIYLNFKRKRKPA